MKVERNVSSLLLNRPTQTAPAQPADASGQAAANTLARVAEAKEPGFGDRFQSELPGGTGGKRSAKVRWGSGRSSGPSVLDRLPRPGVGNVHAALHFRALDMVDGTGLAEKPKSRGERILATAQEIYRDDLWNNKDSQDALNFHASYKQYAAELRFQKEYPEVVTEDTPAPDEYKKEWDLYPLEKRQEMVALERAAHKPYVPKDKDKLEAYHEYRTSKPYKKFESERKKWVLGGRKGPEPAMPPVPDGVKEARAKTIAKIDEYFVDGGINPAKGQLWCGSFAARCYREHGFKEGSRLAGVQKSEKFFTYGGDKDEMPTQDKRRYTMNADALDKALAGDDKVLSAKHAQKMVDSGVIAKADFKTPEGLKALSENGGIRKGDIVLTSEHVSMVDSFTYDETTKKATLVTISGNGGGKAFDGNDYTNSVVKATFTFPDDADKIRGIGQAADSDFKDPAAP